jgi:RNA polymerase sigma-70 factor (ECF subfamily)
MGVAREIEVDPSHGPLAACYNYFGYVPGIYRSQTVLARLVHVEIGLEGSILYDDSSLTHCQKERLLLMLASTEGRIDLATAHYEMLRVFGETEADLHRLVTDFQHCCLPAPEVELLRFALKLGGNGPAVGTADIETLTQYGWTPEHILEAVLISAWYRFVACISIGIGAAPDFPPAPLARPVTGLHEEFCVGPDLKGGPYILAPELAGDQFPAISIFRDLFGFVPNVFRSQAVRPKVIQAEAEVLGVVLSGEDLLSRRQKEQILIAVSAASGNSYFVVVHSEILSALGVALETSDRIAQDHRRAGLDQADAGLLDFALKLAAEPSAFGADDGVKLRRLNFSDGQILEAVVMTGLTKFLNTVQFGIGAPPDFEPRIALPTNPLKIANLFDKRHRPSDGEIPFDPDADAIAKIRNGDSDAFEVLVTRHSRLVYRTLLGILGSPEEARDAMQDTFLKAYQHLDRFEGRSKFSTWLVSIATNTGLQVLRDRKPLQSLEYDAADSDDGVRPRQIRAWADDPEQLYSKAETRSLVEQGVLNLPAKYRVVLMLRDIEQLSIEEAAAALNLGIPALKSRHLRGRLMLREALTPHFAESVKGEIA